MAGPTFDEPVQVSALGKVQVRLQATSGISVPNTPPAHATIALGQKGIDANTRTVLMDGTIGEIYLGGNGANGDLLLFPSTATTIDTSSSGKATIGLKGAGGHILLRDKNGNDSIGLNGSDAILNVGAREGNRPGWFQVWCAGQRGQTERRTMFVDGSAGDIVLRDKNGTHSFSFHSGDGNIGAGLWIGSKKEDSSNQKTKSGFLVLREDLGKDSIVLDGSGGGIAVKDRGANPTFGLYSEGFVWNDYPVAWFAVGKHKDEEPKDGRKAGVAVVRNPQGDDSIILDGTKGDIVLANADCAEEFNISSTESLPVEPGTVMVIDNEEILRISSMSYDKRVAGVISGAGDCRPGIILDKKKSGNSFRAPVALVGKVNCKVDADYSAVGVGDMLTTSDTPGHAMKATNRTKSFGAVIGKALGGIKCGRDLIPILVALQ